MIHSSSATIRTCYACRRCVENKLNPLNLEVRLGPDTHIAAPRRSIAPGVEDDLTRVSGSLERYLGYVLTVDIPHGACRGPVHSVYSPVVPPHGYRGVSRCLSHGAPGSAVGGLIRIVNDIGGIQSAYLQVGLLNKIRIIGAPVSEHCRDGTRGTHSPGVHAHRGKMYTLEDGLDLGCGLIVIHSGRPKGQEGIRRRVRVGVLLEINVAGRVDH